MARDERPGPRFGARLAGRGVHFAAWSGQASRLWVSLFDAQGAREVKRVEMQPAGGGVHSVTIEGIGEGARYGLRADGPYAPDVGLWFDPDKLLVDPYAVEIDRPYAYDPRLSAKRGSGADTAALMPKAVVRRLGPPLRPKRPCSSRAG